MEKTSGSKHWRCCWLYITLFFPFIANIAFAQSQVDILLLTESGSKAVRVDSKETNFVVLKEHGLRDIRGLSKLEKLSSITIDISSLSKGLDFLCKYPQITTLVLSFTQGIDNLSVLKKLPHLEQLVLRSLALEEVLINLEYNTSLEYLELSNCRIANSSIAGSLPDSLKFINLSYNLGGFDYSALLNKMEKVPFVIVNPKAEIQNKEAYKNLYMGIDPWTLIPKEYYHPSS